MAVERIDIDEPAAELLAVDLRLEPIDGDPVGAEREFAAGAQQPGRPAGRAGAAFEPGQQRLGIARLHAGRTMKVHPLVGETEPAAHARRRESGRAELEMLEIPALGVGCEVSAHVAQGTAGERHAVNADSDPPGDRQLERAREELGQFLHGGQRRTACRFRQRQQGVEIELSPGKDGVIARILAEPEIRRAAQSDRALVGPVLKFGLVEQGVRSRGLDMPVAPPGNERHAVSRRIDHSGGPGQLERTFELGRRVREMHHAVGFRRPRPVPGVDLDMQLYGFVFEPAGRKRISVALAIGLEASLPLCGTEQRAKLPRERQPVDHQPPATCRVTQHDAAALDHEAIDRELIRSKVGGVFWPIDRPVPIEPDMEFRS